jgi:DNA-damage-inducible protein J
MPKTAMVRARVEPRLKHRAERVLTRIGLTPTEAITIFYRQVELRNGLPFEVVIPNATTLRTFRDSEAGRDRIVCENAEDMFKKLGI